MKALYILVAVLASFAFGDVPKVKVQPESYELTIKTSEKEFKDSEEELRYEGMVKITFKVLPPEPRLFYFLVDVKPGTKITELRLHGKKEKFEEISNVTHKHENSFLNVTVGLKPEDKYEFYEMHITFTNPYQNDMTGFYRSYYYTPEGQKRWLLTTHFEPMYARKAFPCFDDPSLKAVFKIALLFPKTLKGYHALCNTPPKEIFTENDLNVVACENTLPMPTYLVAFAISDFAKTETVKFESKYPEQFPIERNLTTYGRESLIKAGDGKLSIDVGKDSVTLLSKYVEKGYAFPKVDFIGIPDFSAGAMENWGLITFRERILFYNEAKGTALQKQSNILTIIHELVHQWFGNLVTLKSWNYIWLNEAFANYLSYVIADKLSAPKTAEWDYMKQLLQREVHTRALEADGMVEARSLSHEFKDENLISSAFDDIPYAKGSSVLRMWDLSLPKDSFRKSLVHYLNKNEFKNVVPDDLYASFKEISNMDKDFFNSWHENAGYPVVNVEKNGTIYTLSQDRFFWEKPDKAIENTKYTLPITYTEEKSVSNFDTIPNIWLKKENITLNITSKWFVINNQQAGYYRVNYNPENWMALTEALMEKNHSNIHEINRAQIVNDVFSLARSVHKNFVSYDVALGLSRFLKNETSYFVWKSAFHSFNFLLSKLSQEIAISDMLKEFILELMKPHFKPLNETSSIHLERLKTSLMAQWACALNYEPCINSARDLKSSASKYPDVEEVILCNSIKLDDKVWNDIFEKYKAEIESSRKMMYLSVLGCATKEETLQHYLNFTISKDKAIRRQDRTFALASVYKGSPKNVEIAFKFIEENFKAIVSEFGESNALGNALNGIARNLHSQDDITRMEKLTNKIKEDESLKVPPKSLSSAVSIVKNNRAWLQERADQVKNYLNSSSSLSYSLLILFFSTLVVFEF